MPWQMAVQVVGAKASGVLDLRFQLGGSLGRTVEPALIGAQRIRCAPVGGRQTGLVAIRNPGTFLVAQRNALSFRHRLAKCLVGSIQPLVLEVVFRPDAVVQSESHALRCFQALVVTWPQ